VTLQRTLGLGADDAVGNGRTLLNMGQGKGQADHLGHGTVNYHLQIEIANLRIT